MMFDLNKEREAFAQTEFNTFGLDVKDFKTTGEYFMFIGWLMRLELEKAKAQAVPTWIPTSTMLPDEGEEVLFLDSHNVIHEGSLNTDYVDGPYGENNEDNGDYQTLWTSNSNGEEFLLEEIKFWMARPSDPITCGSGAANE